MACVPWPAGMWWLRAGTRVHPQQQSKSDTESSGLAFFAPQSLGDLFGMPKIVLHFGLGEYLWGRTLKHLLGLVWPRAGGSGQCPLRVCHAPSLLLVQLPRKLFQQPPKEEIVIFWSSCWVHQPGGQQRMSTAEEGSGATSGQEIIWFG